MLGPELRIRVASPPVDGAANEALVRFLADTLDLPRSQVRLVNGAASSHKTFELHGLSASDIASRLGLDA